MSDALSELKAQLLREAGHAGSKATQPHNKIGNAPMASASKPKLKAAFAARLRADDEAIARKLEEERARAATAARTTAIKASASSAPASVEGPKKEPYTSRTEAETRAAAKRTMWGLIKSSIPEIEVRATKVDVDTCEAIAEAISTGADLVSNAPGPDLDDGFIVGFDLGTSSLKCAVGQPYTADDPVRALEAPLELRSGGHPHLWQTVVWFDRETERFSLYPTQGAIALGGFKTGLISGEGHTWAAPDLRITKAHAAVAFIALQLAYVLGRYQLTRPLGPKAGSYFLSVNVGVPVAAHDDGPLSREFKRVIAAAFDLVPVGPELSFKDVESSYRRALPELPGGFELVPELAAAISAYAVQPTSPVGAHMLVDVGASTLDIVAFNLIEKKRVSVFNTSVELLGSGVLDVVRRAGIDDAIFKRACDDAFHCVFGGARSPQRAPSLFHPAHRKQPVQLLTTGGGCLSQLHAKFIDEMPIPNLLGEVPVARPLPPSNISPHECDTSRLLLAYGLTRDVPDLLSVRLPSEIEDLPSHGSSDPSFVSKDCV